MITDNSGDSNHNIPTVSEHVGLEEEESVIAKRSRAFFRVSYHEQAGGRSATNDTEEEASLTGMYYLLNLVIIIYLIKF